jgi:hypothetical protein
MFEFASNRVLGSIGHIFAGMLASIVLTPAVAAQTAVPDFSPSSSVGWIAFSNTFIPPLNGPGPVTDDPAHPRITNDDFRLSGRQPTFPIADINNPILQPWVRETLKKRNERILAGLPAFTRQASCWPIGVPGFLLLPVQPVYFIQSPKEVLMIWQADHQVRHVYLNTPHSLRVAASPYGESIGHYEGDTLVADTIGIDTNTVIDSFQTPHSDQLHVVERFHMIDGGRALEVNLHVEDPGAFTTPWNAIQRYRRVEPGKAENLGSLNAVSSTTAAGPMIEASCAENPVSYFGNDALPIPQADKPDF